MCLSLGLYCGHLVSVRIFGVIYDHTFLNLQITRSHQAIHKVGCLLGDYIWPLQSSSGVLYCMTPGLCENIMAACPVDPLNLALPESQTYIACN